MCRAASRLVLDRSNAFLLVFIAIAFDDNAWFFLMHLMWRETSMAVFTIYSRINPVSFFKGHVQGGKIQPEPGSTWGLSCKRQYLLDVAHQIRRRVGDDFQERAMPSAENKFRELSLHIP